MKIRYTLFFFCLLLVVGAKAQGDTASHSGQEIYTFVDHMPDAGYDCQDYLNKHIHYPDSAVTHSLQGKSIIKFVVNEDGHISDCNVAKKAGVWLDDEALRVVKSFPAWKPGTQNGKAVKVYFVVPVTFNLADIPDEMPAPGYNLVEYIAANVQYPRTAWKEGKQGVVRISFVVNEDSSISNCEVMDSVCEELNLEALRIVKSLPKWKPATHEGKPAKHSVVLPITFAINRNDAIKSKSRPMKSDNTSHRNPVGRVK